MIRDVRIAVYGDMNLNVIDGSSIWLQSVVTALSRQPRNAVTVVLRAGEQRDLLTAPLRRLPGVTVVSPVDEGRVPGPEMSRNQALDELERLDAQQRFDLFILRGFALSRGAAARKSRVLAGRMCPYLTDIPQRPEELTPEVVDQLKAIAAASRYLLCQTEALRTHLESWIPGIAGKAILLEPMIPDQLPARCPAPAPLADGEPLRLIYVGKYAPLWNTLEMTQATAELRAAGMAVELHMIGDKIHRPRDDAGWYERMERALTGTPGVHWHHARSREETLAMLADHHVALGWRAPGLDDSMELSTKLLEYGAVGIPALVNRTPMHEELLGADYPLFAGSRAEFDRVVAAARDPAVRRLAVERCAAASRGFASSAVGARLQAYIDRAVPRRDLRASGRPPLRVLVPCHDFKFFGRIQEHLAGIRGVELRLDAWRQIDQHDTARSQELLDWADVILCEWCANNAVWYSRHLKPGKKLLVRLHRFELFGQYVQDLDLSKVDRIAFVGDYYRDEAITRLGWPRDKLTVIPNWVDTRMLDRPKHQGACFNLGFIGFVPRLKRLDRALTVLERLRAVDERFQLHVKGKPAWEHWWIWHKPEEESYYRELFQRINTSPLLQGAVHFDGFGADVAAWLRKIGFVLSTSDLESFHLAAAEGMASRAVALMLPWGGVEAIYPGEWILPDEDRMAATILDLVDAGAWEPDGERARKHIEASYTVERVCADWERLVLETAGRQ